MTWITSLLTDITLNKLYLYIILFLGSFFETLIGPGFFIYGEIFFFGGAILAGTGILNIWLVAVFCILGGIIGDSASFFIGKKFGRQLTKRFIKSRNKYLNWKNFYKTERTFNRYGKKVIFFARLLGPLSWVTPFFSGLLKVEYKEFLKYNIPGVIVGIGHILILGYFFGYTFTTSKEIFFPIAIIGGFLLIYLSKKLLKKLQNKRN